MRRALVVALLLAACKKEPPPAQVVEPPPIAERAPFPKSGLHAKVAHGLFALLLTGGDTVDKALRACPIESFRHVPFGARPPEDAATVGWKRVALTELPAPDAEILASASVGLTDAETASAPRAAGWLMLAFTSPKRNELVRRSGEAMECLARNARALIFDQHTWQIFSAASWKLRRLDSSAGGIADVTRHVVVGETDDGALRRLATAGMAKFGLPDLLAERVARSDVDSLVSVINLACQTLVERSALDDNGRLTVDVAALRHAGVRESYKKSIIGKAEGRATLELALAERKPDDPENTLVEIRFAAAGPTLQQQHDALVKQIFGARDDKVTHHEHGAALLAVSAAAKKKLATYQPRFKKGLAPKERLLVKAPFKTSSDGNEWMWVEVTEWNGDKLRGVLVNEPVEVPGLRAGATVEVSQASLFDYAFYRSDGTTDGNETAKLLQQGAR